MPDALVYVVLKASEVSALEVYGCTNKELSVSEFKPTLIYLDTNVYARPFDDQTQPTI